DETFAPGIESLETGLFEEAEIPWSQMAFPVVVQSLERYFSDRQRDHFPTFLGTLEPIKR
ncbi:MAG: NUDIX hydrolase, partial [Arenicellales bacterium]